MWGNISTEASYQLNFNAGFSTTRSDVLLHLAQWQYWWWFWFAFLWCFYYLVLLRTVKNRVLKMRPKITTSYRPHGKWGDFLAGIIPAIWCINILTNSNLILRLIEWQNEASLFTIRIRSRQWYWIYKFELKNFTDILTSPKNVGSNKWVVSTFGDLQTADDYLHVLQLRAQSKWVKSYWQDVITREAKPANHHLVSGVERLRVDMNELNSQIQTVDSLAYLNVRSNNTYFINSSNFSLNSGRVDVGRNELFGGSMETGVGLFMGGEDVNFSLKNVGANLALLCDEVEGSTSNVYQSSDIIETTRWAKRSLGVQVPFRLIKLLPDAVNTFDKSARDYVDVDLFDGNFGAGDNTIQSKPLPHTKYLTLKQQRAKRKKIVPLQKTFKTIENGKPISVRYSGHPVLVSGNVLESADYDPNVQYTLMSKNKIRSETIPVTLARRLLRTKRILVIPAHVNVTAITNSYDIVHSWFVPGLGLKLDCVPGRSTHHTFYIDSVGFYYGMCAEICGRYHHHMPIRICALPFEHFLVWWQTFGMPKLLFTTTAKKYNAYYAFRKYVW